MDAFRSPARLFIRPEVLQRRSPAPAGPGLYAWFFREIPKAVPVENCITHDGLTLLYVGIAPSREDSKATLRRRLRQHYAGNASASTLRMTLGCLLGLPLLPVGKKKRLTFGVDGEKRLSDWMAQNAQVCWVEHPTPWEVEAQVITALRPPLNLDDNTHHPFCATLRAMRYAAKKMARRVAGVPDVLILSEKNAQLYTPSGREICVSVTDVDDDPLPTLSDAFLAILRLKFTDIDEPDPDPAVLLFNADHANQIVNFVGQWRDVDRIVIHCMAGQSRSPGIALGLCELFSWDIGDMEERYPWANPWVRNELVKVGREVLNQQPDATSDPDAC